MLSPMPSLQPVYVTPPSSDVAAYLQSGFNASAPVDATLLLATPAEVASSNVLSQEMENLSLPDTVNILESGATPLPYITGATTSSVSFDPTTVLVVILGIMLLTSRRKSK